MSQWLRWSEAAEKRKRDNSLFFFGSKRHWLFPENNEEIVDSKAQPTDYLSFDKKLLDL